MPTYRQIKPVMQSEWYTCWAASLSWWSNAMSDKGRSFLSEEEVMKKFPNNWDKNGAMTLQGLANMFRDENLKFCYRYGGHADLDNLVRKLGDDPVAAVGAFPMIVGYHDGNAGGNHVAVICQPALDVYARSFIMMDPFRGSYVTRDRDYLASQTMVFAWPKEAGQVL